MIERFDRCEWCPSKGPIFLQTAITLNGRTVIVCLCLKCRRGMG